MRACITSILGIPNDKKLPNIDNENWYWEWEKFLKKFGLSFHWTTACWRDGYWMATVPSLNFEGGTHAIVMKDTKVYWDPSTKKRYKAGTEMLSKDLVQGGYYFEVEDSSKIHKLEEYRKKLLTKSSLHT